MLIDHGLTSVQPVSVFAVSLTKGFSGIFEPQTLVACGLRAMCALPDSRARPSTAVLPLEAEGILPLGVLTAHGDYLTAVSPSLML